MIESFNQTKTQPNEKKYDIYMPDTHQTGSEQPEGQNSTSRLIILRGPQAGEKILLKLGTNLFGREEGFLLRDARVSRRHAQIQNTEDEFILTDLDSTNGTFVNGNRIDQPISLQHGDSIRMGDTILTFRMEGSTQNDPSIVGARTPDSELEHGDSTLLVGRLYPQNSTQPDENKPQDLEN